jgi:hypothetical protein
MTSTPAPLDFHLRLIGDELILREGPGYRRKNKSIRKVLVIGGGVTGLTVRCSSYYDLST